MFNFLKNKNVKKISILFSILLIVFFYCFFDKSINKFKLENAINKVNLFEKSSNFYNNFFEIKKISLNGRYNQNLDLVKDIVHSNLSKNKNIIQFNTLEIKNNLERLNWIDTVSIRKIYPNHIFININEHKEFAILNKNKKSFLISDKGKIIYEIKNPKSYKLIHIKGNVNVKNINKIKYFLEQNNTFSKQITQIHISSNDQWNLKINKTIFKLPNENKKEAIKEINKFSNIKNLEIVDLRFFEKKIFMKINSKKIAMRKK